VEATIYFWGPAEEDSFEVEHIHANKVTSILTATKVSPETLDENGRALFVMTTTSFSDFYVGGQPGPRPFPFLPAIFLAHLVVIAIVFFKH